MTKSTKYSSQRQYVSNGVDIRSICAQFPILKQRVRGKPLVYFDNAATTQKPVSVLEAMDRFYRSRNAPVHRSIYGMAEAATAAYEGVRDSLQVFLNAAHREEIIFTSGTTASINAIISGYAEARLKRGDHVLLSDMEHHSMIVPWQAAALRNGLRVDFVPITAEGRIDLAVFKKLVAKHHPKFVGLTHVSNVLGTVNPVREMIAAAHKIGAVVLVDAAQSAPHMQLNVQHLNCDFLAFSGHKIYGPNGIGVLYGKKKLLEDLPPYLFGGHMIESVTRKKTIYAPLPAKFEAGTPPVAEVVGLGAAISFLQKVGWRAIQKHEHALMVHALRALREVPGLTLLGPTTPHDRVPIFSFSITGIHPHDGAALLDREGIAVRAGHHCTQILHDRFSLAGSMRMSLGIYNTIEEIDLAIRALIAVRKKFHE